MVVLNHTAIAGSYNSQFTVHLIGMTRVMQVFSHNVASVQQPPLPLLPAYEATSSNLSGHAVFPILHSVLQTNILQQVCSALWLYEL